MFATKCIVIQEQPIFQRISTHLLFRHQGALMVHVKFQSMVYTALCFIHTFFANYFPGFLLPGKFPYTNKRC